MEVQDIRGYKARLLSEFEFMEFWPEIRDMMDRIPHTWADHLTKESVYDRALNGTLQVWGVGAVDVEMVLFTQVARFAAGSSLQIIWGAGEAQLGKKIEILDDALTYFAKTQECHRIEIIGRAGWEKLMSPLGFKKVAVVLSRNVVHRGMQ